MLDIYPMSNQEVFTKIYKERIRGKGTPSSPSSGDGSLPDISLPYLQFVRSAIQDNEIESVFDFGHGDLVMWRDYKFEDVSYLGIDIAEGLSQRVGAIYENPTRKFRHSTELKKGFPAADLFISKEVFQHIFNSDVTAVLQQLKPFKYLILCNGIYPSSMIISRLKYRIQIKRRFRKILNRNNPFYKVKPLKNNLDINSGDFRGIDLEVSPFSECLSTHRLVSKFDFPGRRGSAVRVRTYFYVSNSI